MTTRSELRAQQEGQQAGALEEEPKRHHHFFNFWGIVLLSFFVLSLILNTTVLNQHFVLNEIKDSVIETTITDQVNGGLERYGVPTSVLTDKDTDRLLSQAVEQVYAGKQIHLNLNAVTQRAGATADNQLSQYGLAGAGTMVSDAVGQNVNAVVNSQLNTPVVARLTSGIRLAKAVTNAVFVVTGIGLIVLAILALFGRYLIQSFSWIGCISVIVDGILCGLVGKLAPQLAADQPDYAAFVAQMATDFMRIAFSIIGVVLVITVILFSWRIIGRRLLSRR